MVAALEAQYVMTRLARDRGWDAVATGQHYLGEGVRQLQLVLARLAAEAGEMARIAGVLLATSHNPVEVAGSIVSLGAIWRAISLLAAGASAASSNASRSSDGCGPRTASASRTKSASSPTSP